MINGQTDHEQVCWLIPLHVIDIKINMHHAIAVQNCITKEYYIYVVLGETDPKYLFTFAGVKDSLSSTGGISVTGNNFLPNSEGLRRPVK